MSSQRGSDPGVVERTFERGRAAEAVVYAVADAVGVDPLSIDPIYDSVDPDALDALLEYGPDDLVVTFSHHGVPVEVIPDGTVWAITGTVG